MDKSEKGYVPEQEEKRHLPIQIKWILDGDPTKTEERIQKFDGILKNIIDSWLSEEQQKIISQKFHKVMIDLENSKDLTIKIYATHAVFDVSVTTKYEVLLIQERNHNQKL